MNSTKRRFPESSNLFTAPPATTGQAQSSAHPLRLVRGPDAPLLETHGFLSVRRPALASTAVVVTLTSQERRGGP